MSRETDFIKGAQLVIEAMLQSPNFLFRLDETSDPKWKPYVTASRLSYAIWDTMPDAELFAAAARGELATPQGVEKAARRMLDHPRAREALDEFVSQWLRFDRILTASKDRRKFPQFTRETAVAMTEEARIFVGDLVWNDRNFMELFTANYGYRERRTGAASTKCRRRRRSSIASPSRPDRSAPACSVRACSSRSRRSPRIRLPPRAACSSASSFSASTCPIRRAGVNTNLPPVTEAKPQTNRDRMSEHATNPSCATCHKLIDPIGFGLEKFDAVGAKRDKFTLQFSAGRGGGEGGGRRAPPKTMDLDIDATGYVAGIPDSQFSSPSQLGAVLAKSAQCQECMVKQYFRYTRAAWRRRPIVR